MRLLRAAMRFFRDASYSALIMSYTTINKTTLQQLLQLSDVFLKENKTSHQCPNTRKKNEL